MRVAKKKNKKKSKGNPDDYKGYLSPTENGSATVFSTEKIVDAMGGVPAQETHDQICKALGYEGYGSCSTAEQLRLFKKYVPKLLSLYLATHEVLCASVKNEERLYDSTAERSRKRWDKDEDDLLVELASRGEMSMTELAVTMGRTPGAIQTRLSQLVGIGRISQSVAGKFIGTLNGENVHGYIDGSLQKVNGDVK